MPLRALFCVAALSLAGCVDPCGNTIFADVASPDHSNRAIVFERSCGATTGFSVQVSVLNARDPQPRGSGNVFVADANHAADAHVQITVHWFSRDQLVIRYPAAARVFRRETRINGITVVYETV